jgi:uncharacterized protein (TIGR02466 family)
MPAILQPAVSLDDDALLASPFTQKGDVLAALQRVAADHPTRAAAWTSLGIAQARSGDFASAVSAFERALSVAPGHVLATGYLAVCLHALARDKEAREILDHEGMIEIAELDAAADEASRSEFNRALYHHIAGHPSATWQLPGKATRGGFQTGELLTDDAPEVMRHFASLLSNHLRRLLDDTSAQPAWRLTAWGVRLDSGGYQEPHVHQAGLLSGVYYVQVPPARPRRDSGALRFSRQLPWLPHSPWARALSAHLVFPRAGMLAIFPSYFWHETVPFEAQEQRVSIAFDVLPPSAE